MEYSWSPSWMEPASCPDRMLCTVLSTAEGVVPMAAASTGSTSISARGLPSDRLVETVATRHIRYNRTLEEIEAGKGKGELFVIQPQKALEVGRTEKNREKLDAAYRQGWQDAQQAMADLKEFLGKA